MELSRSRQDFLLDFRRSFRGETRQGLTPRITAHMELAYTLRIGGVSVASKSPWK
jgi:hypothetical protein